MTNINPHFTTPITAPISVSADAKVPAQDSRNKAIQLHQQISEIMSSNEDFTTKTENVIKLLGSALPPPSELSNLRKFCEENSDKLGRLQEIGSLERITRRSNGSEIDGKF